MKPPTDITIIPVREDWSINIRLDGPEPWLEVRSEFVTRNSGARQVVQGLPAAVSTIAELSTHPVTLADGHKTTLGALVAALRAEVAAAIDEHVADLPDDPEDRKPAKLHEKLQKARKIK